MCLLTCPCCRPLHFARGSAHAQALPSSAALLLGVIKAKYPLQWYSSQSRGFRSRSLQQTPSTPPFPLNGPLCFRINKAEAAIGRRSAVQFLRSL